MSSPPSSAPGPALPEPVLASARFHAVRKATEALCAPLVTEDYVVQTMDDVSPPKWHLGHTTWFYETMILERYADAYAAPHECFRVVFNSYYETVGAQWCQPRRGCLSRPTVDDVYSYRQAVDAAMTDVLDRSDGDERARIEALLDIGLAHEQQHQELLVTDIKHILATNPLRPLYAPRPSRPPARVCNRVDACYVEYPGGIHEIGWDGDGFAYDNERPRHRVYLEPFTLADQQVTNAEWLAFIRDGGYSDVRLWLSDAWGLVQQERWRAPLYWEQRDGEWWSMTLAGFRPVDLDEPVCHVSYYEADAFARWCGARLPTEAEWEVAAAAAATDEGNFLDDGLLHPVARRGPGLLGNVWEWTATPYRPYPGYRPYDGPLAEYNAKFMSNTMVLRGGSCATPRDHIRPTYRNFFAPSARWQFAGLRLAR